MEDGIITIKIKKKVKDHSQLEVPAKKKPMLRTYLLAFYANLNQKKADPVLDLDQQDLSYLAIKIQPVIPSLLLICLVA